MVEGARRNRVFSKYRIICINYISLLHGYAVVITRNEMKKEKEKREKQQQK